ncbi:hypothetical protein D9M69_632970 [compost metagenome]
MEAFVAQHAQPARVAHVVLGPVAALHEQAREDVAQSLRRRVVESFLDLLQFVRLDRELPEKDSHRHGRVDAEAVHAVRKVKGVAFGIGARGARAFDKGLRVDHWGTPGLGLPGK